MLKPYNFFCLRELQIFMNKTMSSNRCFFNLVHGWKLKILYGTVEDLFANAVFPWQVHPGHPPSPSFPLSTMDTNPTPQCHAIFLLGNDRGNFLLL
jgi:hypothetical protein